MIGGVRRGDWGLWAALGGAVTMLAGFVFGAVGDAEDFYTTAVGTRLFFRSLADGTNPFWTDLLGLGLPQPFRISLVQHPLGPLFALMDPLAAIKAVVVVQGLAATVCVYLLCRRLAMERLVAATCALSFISSTSVLQYLFIDDYFSQFLSVCLVPAIVLALVGLFDARPGRHALVHGLWTGWLAGLLVATGLASLTATYALVLVVFLAASPATAWARRRELGVALLVCLLASSGLVTLLASELVRFPDDALRAVHPNASPLVHALAALGIDVPGDLRVTGFGPVAAVAAGVALWLPLGPHGWRLKASFVASFVFLLLPAGAYFSVISATWTFRDSLNLFGILLFGALLSARRWPRPLVATACISQLVFLGVLALPSWSTAIRNAREPGGEPSQVTLRGGGAFFQRVHALIGAGPHRIVLSDSVTDESRVEGLRSGGVINAGSLTGVRVLNTFARGIATNGLHPDEGLMEGMVSVTDRNLASRDFLDVLGLTHVLAFEGERPAEGLERVGEVPMGRRTVIVWRNPTAWPVAVEIDPAGAGVELPLAASCGHDRFLCSDFSAVRGFLRDRHAPVAAALHGGNISVTLEPASTSRFFLVTSWYRPEWTATDPRIEVMPAFGQLTGVRVPAGVEALTLVYRPLRLMAAYVVSTIVLVAVPVLAVLITRRRGGRSVSS